MGKKQICPYCKEKVDLKRMFPGPYPFVLNVTYHLTVLSLELKQELNFLESCLLLTMTMRQRGKKENQELEKPLCISLNFSS